MSCHILQSTWNFRFFGCVCPSIDVDGNSFNFNWIKNLVFVSTFQIWEFFFFLINIKYKNVCTIRSNVLCLLLCKKDEEKNLS